MRADEKDQYAIVFDKDGMKYKKIEKPVVKPKLLRYKLDEEGQKICETVSRSSDMLELDIFNEDDMNKAQFKYKMDQPRGAFDGSYGDLDDMDEEMKASMRQKQLQKALKGLSKKSPSPSTSNEMAKDVKSEIDNHSKTVSMPPDNVVNEQSLVPSKSITTIQRPGEGALAERHHTASNHLVDLLSGSNQTGPQNLLIGSFPAAGANEELGSVFDEATR